MKSERLKKIISNIEQSFNTKNEGYSSRKLTAFVIISLVIIAHIAWLKKAFIQNDFTLLENILIIDYSFIAALFGMTTYSGMKTKEEETKDENKKN